MNVLYKATVTTTAGRDGRAVASDNRLDVALSMPRELGGNGAAGTNPEQLFAAGYSACFLSALKFVAAQQKIAVPADATVRAEVGIGQQGQGFALDVELFISLPGVVADTARQLVDTAHQVCPYSNATRNGLAVRLTLVA